MTIDTVKIDSWTRPFKSYLAVVVPNLNIIPEL